MLTPILMICVHVCAASYQTEVITTSTGSVQGVIESSSIKDIKVQKFSNIPYAEAPVGKLRFSKPVAKKPWNGTLGNSTDDIACWQQWQPNVKFTEDCLILNIWTPYPPTKNYSVLIWIHGGSFATGRSGSYLGHNFVAIGDVILVTINYRLSFLGFLSSGDQRIKGNFALFDQRLAMKWVKKNIIYFGGNPNSITLFGVSAGAAMVSAHTLSRNSWPYFNKAIPQSGGMLTPWSVLPNPSSKELLRLFISKINCTDNENLLECLQTNVTSKVLERIYKSDPFVFNGAVFRPLIDGDFLTDDPNTLWSNKEVKKSDVIIGVTKYEALYWFSSLTQWTRNISVYNKTFHDRLNQYVKSFNSQAIHDQALELYKPKCLPSFVEALKPLLTVVSDVNFVCPAVREANLWTQIFNSTNVYLYRFSYASPLPWKWFSSGTFGLATHGADTVAQFGSHINNSRYPSEDQIISMRMILYLTNFAKSGDPNVGITKLPIMIDNIENLPNWPKYTNSGREYLDMESLSRMIPGKRLRGKQCEFWQDPAGFTAKNAHKPTTTSGAKKHTCLQIVMLLVILII